MTIASAVQKLSYTGNGSLAVYAYSFKIFATSDLQVVITSTAGIETTKTLGTHYNVSGAGSASGGNVTFTGGNTPADGELITISRQLALTQVYDYVENDSFSAEDHEESLDRLVGIAQQLNENTGRTVKTPISDTGVDMTLPAKAARASKLLSFDAAGDPETIQEIGTYRGNWAASTVYALRDIVKDTATNNIFITTTAHTSSGSQPLTSNADSAKWTLIVDAASATTSAQLADDWAVKTNGVVESSEYSSKAYAIGGTGVTTTSGKGAAKEWATTTGGAVDTSEYSSKEYAIGTTVGVGSAKDWAVLAEDSAVTGSSYSALHHAAKGAASATAAASSATSAEASAGAVAFKYNFDNSTSVADPGSNGEWRWNHGTVGSVSSMAIRAATADTGNPDISPYIITWDDSTSTVNGHLLFRKSGTPATFAVFTIGAIVDNSDWLQVALTHVASNGTWSNADTGYVSFIARNGDKGDTGATGAAGEGSMDSFIMSDGSTTQEVEDGETQIFAAGEGLDVAVSATNTVTYSGEDASTSNKGVASFSSDNFAVSSGAVTIKDGGVVTAEIAADAVTGAKIADDAIDSEHYTDGSVDTAHLAADAVTGAKIADDALDSEHYTDGSIDNAHIADDAIDSEHYAAGSIDTAHIADDQITLAKMAGLARGKLIYGDSSGNPAALAVGSANQVLQHDGTDLAWVSILAADQAWTGSQRGTFVSDNDGSFDMDAGNNFTWTPSGTDVLEFTNETNGQSGLIYLNNAGGHTISLGSEILGDDDMATTISTAGQYLIAYVSPDGTNVAVSYSQELD